MTSIESWAEACAQYQRKADSRRIVAVNERDLRRERVVLVLLLLALIFILSILAVPR